MPRVLLLVLFALLAACSRGPEQQALDTELRQRLEQAFPADSLSLVTLTRRGSASDASAGPDEERLLVYFDAQLRVERDLDFGSWDSPGVASLVSALGAGPRGSIALVRAARARALSAGRDFVTPDDIKSIALPALRHRIALAPDMQLEGQTNDRVLKAIIDSIEAPRA